MIYNIYYIWFVAAVFVPVAWIFTYAGFRPWWAVLLAVPDVGFILCLMVLALRKWPRLQKGAA